MWNIEKIVGLSRLLDTNDDVHRGETLEVEEAISGNLLKKFQLFKTIARKPENKGSVETIRFQPETVKRWPSQQTLNGAVMVT